MIVIVLTNCPNALRGDLTKWLFEIETNIFVGRVSARVRDQLWERVKQHCERGRATMVFSTNNEQHFDFRVQNSEWEPIDLDGFKLMLRPNMNYAGAISKYGYSKASHYSSAKKRMGAPSHSTDKFCSTQCDSKGRLQLYAVVSVETTGPLTDEDTITKLNALRVSNGRVLDSISICVQPSMSAIERTTELKEIDSTQEVQMETLHTALKRYLSFIGNCTLVSHNVEFTMRFISAACIFCNLTTPTNNTEDIMAIAKKTLYNLRNHSISSLIEYFNLVSEEGNSDLYLCSMIMKIYENLLKNEH